MKLFSVATIIATLSVSAYSVMASQEGDPTYHMIAGIECISDGDAMYPVCPDRNPDEYCDGETPGDCNLSDFCDCDAGKDFCTSRTNPCEDSDRVSAVGHSIPVVGTAISPPGDGDSGAVVGFARSQQNFCNSWWNKDERKRQCKQTCGSMLAWGECKKGKCLPARVRACNGFDKKYRCYDKDHCMYVKQNCRDECNEYHFYEDFCSWWKKDEKKRQCKQTCDSKLAWGECKEGKCWPAKVEACDGFDKNYYCDEKDHCMDVKQNCRDKCSKYF